MAAVICGSLAFDTIMTFEGRFAEQILPDQLHILNVSFLVPALRRDFGGCAGNVAYSLNALGGRALPMATVGSDGAGYIERLRSLGISTEFVRDTGGRITDVLTKVNDGSRFGARHRVRANTSVASRALPADSAEFVRRTVLDLARLRTALVERQATAPNTVGLLCGTTLIDALTRPVLGLGTLDAQTLAATQLVGSANGSGSLCFNSRNNLGLVGLGGGAEGSGLFPIQPRIRS